MLLFFLMEETNYQRPPLLGIEPETTVHDKQVLSSETAFKEPTNSGTQLSAKSTRPSDEVPEEVERKSQVSYWKKLRLIRSEDLRKRNQLKGLVLRPIIFLSFPVILFCGFMYGAIVCYFNVLNGTASLILSASPYNFSSSMVGLSYLSCVIGVFCGYVLQYISLCNVLIHLQSILCRSTGRQVYPLESSTT